MKRFALLFLIPVPVCCAQTEISAAGLPQVSNEEPSTGLHQQSPSFHLDLVPQGPLPSPAAEASGLKFKDAAIDPAIIIHPPPGDVPHQQPHTPIAHDLYPGLKVLPLEVARVEPIPRTWPSFRMEPIPRTWPAYKAVPVQEKAVKCSSAHPEPLRTEGKPSLRSVQP